MIIKARHNFIIYNFFKLYTIVRTKRSFREIFISGSFHDKGLPVLLVANHMSWWDGFWAMYLNMKVFRRKFHFIMLEEQLRKNWFFMYTGGFSVRKGTKSVMETLQHASEILERKENLLLIFPQGKIESLYKTEFSFERGIERILWDKRDRIQLVLMADFVEFLSHKKPSLHIFYREYGEGDFSFEALQKEYNNFYQHCREIIISQGYNGI